MNPFKPTKNYIRSKQERHEREVFDRLYNSISAIKQIEVQRLMRREGYTAAKALERVGVVHATRSLAFKI